MISFEAFSPAAGVPIYIQIILHIKRGIAAGTVTDGEEIPSRRVLSALLGINPNTAQKAYRLLEEEGLIESRAGAKSYVRISAETVESVRRELLLREVKGTVYKQELNLRIRAYESQCFPVTLLYQGSCSTN